MPGPPRGCRPEEHGSLLCSAAPGPALRSAWASVNSAVCKDGVCPGPGPLPQVFGLRREQMWSGWNWRQEPSKAGAGRTQPQGRLCTGSSPSSWHLLEPASGSLRPPAARPALPAAPGASCARCASPHPGCGTLGVGTDALESGLRPPCAGTSFYLKDSELGQPAGLFSESALKPEPTAQLPEVGCLLNWETGLGPGSATRCPKRRQERQGPGPVSTVPCTS